MNQTRTTPFDGQILRRALPVGVLAILLLLLFSRCSPGQWPRALPAPEGSGWHLAAADAARGPEGSVFTLAVTGISPAEVRAYLDTLQESGYTPLPGPDGGPKPAAGDFFWSGTCGGATLHLWFRGHTLLLAWKTPQGAQPLGYGNKRGIPRGDASFV